MTFLQIGFISFMAVLVLIAIRVPIGLTLFVVSFVGIWAGLDFNVAWNLLKAIPYSFISNWSFSAVPMFLLMGFLASNGGLTDGLFSALRIVLRRVPGGLACSAVGASALFAAASGSSTATAAAMSRIAVPEMLKAKYDKALATGAVASAGTLGSMIPPSILMIVLAIFADLSVGKLFLAGFIPGIMSAAAYMILIMVRVKVNPTLAPKLDYTPERAELVAALKEVWPLPVLILGVMFGIFTGVMTPTEAGAVGASLAMVLVAARGKISWAVVRNSVREAALGTSTIFIIAVGATLFASLLTLTRVPQSVSGFLLTFAHDPITLLLVISITYIVLGMFIDAIGIMLLTLPVFLPVLIEMDVNLIWFGIIAIKLLEIGMITPPVGLNCFIVGSSLRGIVPLTTVFRGVIPFILMDLVTLGLLIAFPAIALWLPSIAN